MSCSCIPPPASLKPRKIYNFLVPDVFPKHAPAIDEPISTATNSKIGKLVEYVDKNPGKIPKVSRRLTRKIQGLLGKNALGNAKIGVNAYMQLLDYSLDENASYNFNYFSKELVQDPDHLIKTLLIHPKTSVQALGAELLASYIKAQTGTEHQAELVEPLLQRAMEKIINKEAPEELKAACMRAVFEHILFCHRRKMLPANLDSIESCILQSLDLSKVDGQQIERAKSDNTRNMTSSELSYSSLQQLRPFLQDISTVYQVMEVMFKHLDKEQRWEDTRLVETLVDQISKASGDQTFPLFGALMRHSSVEGLTVHQREVVVKMGAQQEFPYPLQALGTCLTEFPVTWARAGSDAGSSALVELLLDTVKKVATKVGDAWELCEVIGGLIVTPPQHSAASPNRELLSTEAHILPSFRCCLAALDVIKTFPPEKRVFPSHVFPGPLLDHLARAASGSWGNGEPQRLGLDMLAEVLPCVQGGVRSEHQAFGLLSLAYQQTARADSSPRNVQLLGRLVAAAVGGKRPSILLSAARMAATLRLECSKTSGRLSDLGAVRQCSVLVLVAATTRALSQVCIDPAKADAIEINPSVAMLEQAVPALKLTEPSPSPCPCPMPIKAVGSDLGDASKKEAEAVLVALRNSDQNTWVTAMATALSSSKLAQQESGWTAEAFKEPFLGASLEGGVAGDSIANMSRSAGQASSRPPGMNPSWSVTRSNVQKECVKLNVMALMSDEGDEVDLKSLKEDTIEEDVVEPAVADSGLKASVKEVLDLVAALPAYQAGKA